MRRMMAFDAGVFFVELSNVTCQPNLQKIKNAGLSVFWVLNSSTKVLNWVSNC